MKCENCKHWHQVANREKENDIGVCLMLSNSDDFEKYPDGDITGVEATPVCDHDGMATIYETSNWFGCVHFKDKNLEKLIPTSYASDTETIVTICRDFISTEEFKDNNPKESVITRKLLCINSNGYIGLTKGLEYTSTSENYIFYFITNNQGVHGGYAKNCFKIIE